MDVAVDELVFEERLALTGDLCCNISGVEIFYEAALYPHRPFLQSARQCHEDDDDNGQRDDDGVGKAGEIVADIEEDGCCDGNSHQDGKDERQTVETAFCPQYFRFLAVVVFHHQSSHKGCYADKGEESCGPIGPPVGEQMSEELQNESEHDSGDGDAENGVDEGVDNHLLQQLSP